MVTMVNLILFLHFSNTVMRDKSFLTNPGEKQPHVNKIK